MTNSAMIPDPWSEPSMHRYPGRIYGQGDAGAEARQRLTKNRTSKKMPLKAASINLGKIHQQTAGFAAGMMLAVNQLGDTNKTIEGRNKSVKRGIVLDKQRWTRKRTRDLRAKQEAGLEEKGKMGLADRYTKKIVNKAGGLFSKAMDIIGWLALGWIVNSFLKVVKIGEEWYKKVKDVWDNITKSVKDFVGWITGNNKKEEELPTFDPEKDIKDLEADVNKTFNDVDKDINDENKNVDNVEGGGEETPNQWWDFLDLFPNKKKDDGQISDDELKEVNEERAIGGQPPLTKKQIEIGEDPEEKNLWEQLSEKVNAIFNRSKSSEKGKNNPQFQKFTKDAKPVNMEGVEIPQTKKISLDLKNEGAPSSEDGSVVEGSDQPNKEKKPIVVDQKDIVSSQFKVSTIKVDEIIPNKKKKKVIVPVNTSNGNRSTVSSGGTKTKIIRVNGGETLNSTIDKVSQLESAYL